MKVEYDKIHSRHNSISEHGPERLLSEHNNLMNYNTEMREQINLDCKVCAEKQQSFFPEASNYKLLIKDRENVIKACKCKNFVHEGCLVNWVITNYSANCPTCGFTYNLSFEKIPISKPNNSWVITTTTFSVAIILLGLGIISFLNVIKFVEETIHWSVILGIIFVFLFFSWINLIFKNEFHKGKEEFFFHLKLDEYKEDVQEEQTRLSKLASDFQHFLISALNVNYEEIVNGVATKHLSRKIQVSERRLGVFLSNNFPKHISNGYTADAKKDKSFRVSSKSIVKSINENRFKSPARSTNPTPPIPPAINNYQNINININNNISISSSKEGEKLTNNKNMLIIKDDDNANSNNQLNSSKKGLMTQIIMNKVTIANLGVDQIDEQEHEYSEKGSEKGTRKEKEVEKNLLKINHRHQEISNLHSVEKLLNHKVKKYHSSGGDFKPNAFFMNCDSIVSDSSRKNSKKSSRNEDPGTAGKLIEFKDNLEVNQDLEKNLNERKNNKKFTNINFHNYQ